jgi:hypothetical protein
MWQVVHLESVDRKTAGLQVWSHNKCSDIGTLDFQPVKKIYKQDGSVINVIFVDTEGLGGDKKE